MKSSWAPDSNDAQPWLQIQIPAPRAVSQIKLLEGKFGSGSKVQQYAIEAKVKGKWQTIHRGKAIGGDCNILLVEPVVSDTYRVNILKFNGRLDLNSFELYE